MKNHNDTQEEKISQLKNVEDGKKLISQRDLHRCIVVYARQNVSESMQLIVPEPDLITPHPYKILNNTMDNMKLTQGMGLIFTKMN